MKRIINQKDITACISERTGYSDYVINSIISQAFSVISESLADGDPVRIQGFGLFEAKHRAPRTARNLITNEPYKLPARIAPVFKPSDKLREAVEAGKVV